MMRALGLCALVSLTSLAPDLSAVTQRPVDSAPDHTIWLRSAAPQWDHAFPVVEATYHARGGKHPRLQGPPGLIKGGRADVRFSIDAAGELYLYSKGDGMIRKVVGATGF